MAEAIYEKFAPALESLDRNILFIASTLESNLNLTNGIFDAQTKQLSSIESDETYSSAIGSILGESLVVQRGLYETQAKLLSVTEAMSKEKPKSSFSFGGFVAAINPFSSASVKATEALETKLNEMSITLTSILGVARSILGNQYAMMGIDREALEDQQRAADFGELDRPTPTPEPKEDKKEPKVKDDGEFPFADILKALALAPFAFRFAKGFVSAITDGLVELTFTGITGLAAMIRGDMNKFFKIIGRGFLAPFTMMRDYITRLSSTAARVAASVGQAIDGAVDMVKGFAQGIKSVTTGTGRIATVVNGVKSFFGGITRLISPVLKFMGSAIRFLTDLPILRTLKLLVTRLAWPLTWVMGIVEAIRSFINSEGTLFEKFGAGVGGFFAEVVGAPLDLLKGMVAWVLDKFGFENASAALSSFSFSDTIRSIIGGMFGFVSDAVKWVKDLFDWGDPDEPFRLTTFVSDMWQNVKDWLKEKLSWIPGANRLLGLEDSEEDLQAESANAADLASRARSADAVALDSEGNLVQADRMVNGVSDVAGAEQLLRDQGLTPMTPEQREAYIQQQEDIVNRNAGELERLANEPGLYDMASEAWDSIKQWFNDKFSWEAITDEWSNLTSFVSGAWTKVKTWFNDKFSWEAITDEWTSLTSAVSLAWEGIKSWFREKLGFGEGEEVGEDVSLATLINSAWEKLKEWFNNIFEDLPSFQEIKDALVDMLPFGVGRLLRGGGSEEDTEAQRAELESQIEDLRNEQSSAPTTEQANQMMDFSGKTQEEYDADIRRLEEQLANLPEANRGGIVNAPESGAPVMLHGQEAIVPLDSPNAANIIRDISGATTLERKTASLEQGSMAVSTRPSPVIVTGGNAARGGDTYNNGGNTTTTTIINQSSDPVRALRHMPT